MQFRSGGQGGAFVPWSYWIAQATFRRRFQVAHALTLILRSPVRSLARLYVACCILISLYIYFQICGRAYSKAQRLSLHIAAQRCSSSISPFLRHKFVIPIVNRNLPMLLTLNFLVMLIPTVFTVLATSASIAAPSLAKYRMSISKVYMIILRLSDISSRGRYMRNLSHDNFYVSMLKHSKMCISETVQYKRTARSAREQLTVINWFPFIPTDANFPALKDGSALDLVTCLRKKAPYTRRYVGKRFYCPEMQMDLLNRNGSASVRSVFLAGRSWTILQATFPNLLHGLVQEMSCSPLVPLDERFRTYFFCWWIRIKSKLKW